jgi:hypothetical protein
VEPSVTTAPWVLLCALATLLALLQTARLAWSRLSRTWALRARARHAADGELRAEPLLRAAGYDVLARQVRGEWTVYADGEPQAFGLRADLLVAKDGRRYVAEVKTGRLAPRLDHAQTRRQLLEYRMAFDVDGVLLVDAEADRVVRVELGVGGVGSGDDVHAGRSAVAFVLVVVAFAVGAVAGWVVHR